MVAVVSGVDLIRRRLKNFDIFSQVILVWLIITPASGSDVRGFSGELTMTSDPINYADDTKMK